jgi:acyl-coenzyme A thioesterase PaaI-like protein
MSRRAFQDCYSDFTSHCYGCGRLNPHGLQIKSYWDGEETVCRFRPRPYHTAVAGYVYGGLIASLIDCHSTGTAAAAATRAEGREMGSEPELRFVTASLHVDFLRPTPVDAELEVDSTLSARGQQCAKGRVVAVLAPEAMSAPRE